MKLQKSEVKCSIVILSFNTKDITDNSLEAVKKSLDFLTASKLLSVISFVLKDKITIEHSTSDFWSFINCQFLTLEFWFKFLKVISTIVKARGDFSKPLKV